jgi:hypothetical protein
MSKLLKELTQFLSLTQKTGLELFLEKKSITNAADIEYWSRYYIYNKGHMYE